MAVDPGLIATAAALVLMTDRGRSAAGAFVRGAVKPAPKKKGKTAAKKSPAKTAGKKAASKKNTVTAKSGAWAGKQTRKAAAALGRGVKVASVKAGTWAGDKAQARLDKRDTPTPLAWRTPPEPEQTPANAPDSGGVREQPTPAGRQNPTPQNLEDLNTPSKSKPAPKEHTMSAEIESPASDGQLLEDLHEQSGLAKQIAESLEEYASVLVSLHLPSSVTSEVHGAAESLGEASAQLVRAANAFMAYFEDARTVAQRGMKFTGEEAA